MIFTNYTSDHLLETIKTRPQDHLVMQSAALRDKKEREKMRISSHLLLLSSMFRALEETVSSFGGNINVDHSIIYRLIHCINTDEGLTDDEFSRYIKLNAIMLKLDRELISPFSGPSSDFIFYIPWEVKSLVIGRMSMDVQVALEALDPDRLDDLLDRLCKEEDEVILTNGNYQNFREKYEREFFEFYQELPRKENVNI